MAVTFTDIFKVLCAILLPVCLFHNSSQIYLQFLAAWSFCWDRLFNSFAHQHYPHNSWLHSWHNSCPLHHLPILKKYGRKNDANYDEQYLFANFNILWIFILLLNNAQNIILNDKKLN